VPLAKLVNPVTMVLLVPLAVLVMLVDPVVQAKLAAQALLEIQAKLAHPEAANTAHQLVWLQVINLPSEAIRMVNNDQKHLQYFGLFTAFSNF